MAADSSDAPQRFQLVLKLVLLALMIAVIGLPINHLFTYALLVIAVIVLAIGRVTAGSGLSVLGLDGGPARFARGSYSHF